MSLDGFAAEVEAAAQKYALKMEILAKTKNAIKIRLGISESIAVQCYFNQRSKTTNFVLIGWARRLYGRDSVGGAWHRHSFEEPDTHDTSGEGSQPVTPEQFLDDVFEILIMENLIPPSFEKEKKKEDSL